MCTIKWMLQLKHSDDKKNISDFSGLQNIFLRCIIGEIDNKMNFFLFYFLPAAVEIKIRQNIGHCTAKPNQVWQFNCEFIYRSFVVDSVDDWSIDWEVFGFYVRCSIFNLVLINSGDWSKRYSHLQCFANLRTVAQFLFIKTQPQT